MGRRETRGKRGRGKAAGGIAAVSYLCALAVAMLLAAGFGGPWRYSGVTKVYRPYLVLELPVPTEQVHSGGLTAAGSPDAVQQALMDRKKLDRAGVVALVREHPWEEDHLIFRYRGKKYELYFVAARGETTQVPIPVGYDYSISGNDEDGFVAAVWKR